jgi:hypothetical protein
MGRENCAGLFILLTIIVRIIVFITKWGFGLSRSTHRNGYLYFGPPQLRLSTVDGLLKQHETADHVGVQFGGESDDDDTWDEETEKLASSDVPVPRPSRGVAIGHLPLRRGFDGAAVVASHPIPTRSLN